MVSRVYIQFTIIHIFMHFLFVLGRPMNIQLTTSLGVFEGGQRQPTRQSGDGATGRRSGGRGGGGGQKGGRNNRPIKSAADLDAELDAHNAKMQTD